jgi:uncharacterized protein YktA (UPF0223 family)
MRHEEHVREEIEMPTYSKEELNDFGTFLDQFRTKKEVVDKKTKEKMTIDPIDMNEAMTSFGAMKKKENHGVITYEVILQVSERDGYGRIKRYERPTQYELFWHKYDAWSHRQYAVQMQNEEYEKMAGETITEPV